MILLPINSCGMNRERTIVEGQNQRAPDPRITVLLGLAFLLFMLNLLSSIPSTWTPHPTVVPGLTIDDTGLALQAEPMGIRKNRKMMDVNATPFFFEPIPVNHASKELLTTIPGVGQVLAQSIVNQRQQKGLFTQPEDLIRVHGIGPKRMVWLTKHLSFEL